ncbi:hypothetical protein BVC80_7763g2 [Macleaya cordata]|uniref:Uncharacterized protein n=1 Tax=Macleaya cordata TaxID=56857 RepID=A0A200QGD1_MACCD|nr:hypothetical protein BVC80_7763g2 [Macleaya cordata]
MSIALERNSNRIEGSGFIGGMSCISIFESPESGRSMNGNLVGDRKFPVSNLGIKGMKKMDERETEEELDSSSSSSSIGRNSDISNGGSSEGGGFDEAEVQSSYKGPFETMDSLEEVLPIRKGISKFYCGKSKSFTSLADASSSSNIKEIAKPENAYSKKRKNLLACSLILDKNKNYPLRSNGGGISKRSITSSRSSLALAVAMKNSESNNTIENSSSPPPPQYRPPLHPQVKQSINNDIESSSSPSPQRSLSSSWRSFSLADLQYAANSMTTTNSSISNGDKHKKLH